MKAFRIGIIGIGNMGGALLKGLAAKKGTQVFFAEKDSAKRRVVRRVCPRAKALSLEELTKTSNVVIICVKPQDLEPVLDVIKEYLTAETLVISIAAGVTLKKLRRLLRHDLLARVMPNLPALTGNGVSAFTVADSRASRAVREIFSILGSVLEVDEKKMDAVTAVSGSGPGYFAFILAEFRTAARRAGLSEKEAVFLVDQTFGGTALFLGKTGLHPMEMVKRVASPGGTTEAGLSVLKQRKMGKILAETVKAAAARSRELKK